MLPGEKIHAIRSRELKRLILYKFIRYPRQAFRLLRRLGRSMPAADILYLLVKPFIGKKSGQTKAEVLSRAIEHDDLMSAAADLTQVPDSSLPSLLATGTDRR